jgi:hypothetical protein
VLVAGKIPKIPVRKKGEPAMIGQRAEITEHFRPFIRSITCIGQQSAD